MSSGEEDLGAMAWPGFVDILSSVIIMFVFFVMVVASALYFHIIIFKSKIMSQIEGQIESIGLATSEEALQEEIKELKLKLKTMEQVEEENEIKLYQQHTKFAESKNQTFIEDVQERSFVIFFGKDSISVTKENYTKLDALIKRYAEEIGANDTTVEIVAAKNPDAENEVIAGDLAVARMLNVRNLFIDGDIPLESLRPTIANGEKIENTYNWVKVTFRRKE